MDPRRLMTFRAVAHAGSFSRAAETMSLTQPSVSHQIALLETEIGVRLLERGRGGLRLTDEGAVLLEHADQVAWRLELAATQLAALAGERREAVRVGAFPTALAGFVPAAVARLPRLPPPPRPRACGSHIPTSGSGSARSRRARSTRASSPGSSTSPSATRTPPQTAASSAAPNESTSCTTHSWSVCRQSTGSPAQAPRSH